MTRSRRAPEVRRSGAESAQPNPRAACGGRLEAPRRRALRPRVISALEARGRRPAMPVARSGSLARSPQPRRGSHQGPSATGSTGISIPAGRTDLGGPRARESRGFHQDPRALPWVSVARRVAALLDRRTSRRLHSCSRSHSTSRYRNPIRRASSWSCSTMSVSTRSRSTANHRSRRTRPRSSIGRLRHDLPQRVVHGDVQPHARLAADGTLSRAQRDRDRHPCVGRRRDALSRDQITIPGALPGHTSVALGSGT